MKIGAYACAVAACLLPQISWCQFGVGDLSILRDYESQRSSSYDPSGGNRNYRSLQAGETLTLLDAHGPGEIRHIWVTMPPWHPGAEIYAPQKTVLRAYWDGETQPSVEAPLGNFFGVCFSAAPVFQSALITVNPEAAMNCYFPMPGEQLCHPGNLRRRPVCWRDDVHLQQPVGRLERRRRDDLDRRGEGTAHTRNGGRGLLQRRLGVQQAIRHSSGRPG